MKYSSNKQEKTRDETIFIEIEFLSDQIIYLQINSRTAYIRGIA